LSAGGDEDIRGITIAVNDALIVSNSHTGGSLNGNLEQRVRGKRQALTMLLELCQCRRRHQVTQCLAFEQFHGNEGPPLILFYCAYGADIRMIQRRGSACLTLESLHGGAFVYKFLRQEFQRNPTSEFQILGLIDHAHTTAAKIS
jgi:hypothetical protein